MQGRDTLPHRSLLRKCGLCSCWVFSKQGAPVSSLEDRGSGCPGTEGGVLAALYLASPGSIPSICSLHMHLKGLLGRRGRRSSWREEGNKDRQFICMEGSEHRCLQQQMAACSRALLGPPVPARGNEREGRPARLLWGCSLERQCPPQWI